MCVCRGAGGAGGFSAQGRAQAAPLSHQALPRAWACSLRRKGGDVGGTRLGRLAGGFVPLSAYE